MSKKIKYKLYYVTSARLYIENEIEIDDEKTFHLKVAEQENLEYLSLFTYKNTNNEFLYLFLTIDGNVNEN